MPEVAVCPMPKGLPMATTKSPTCSASESPNLRSTSRVGSTLTTATSVPGSARAWAGLRASAGPRAGPGRWSLPGRKRSSESFVRFRLLSAGTPHLAVHCHILAAALHQFLARLEVLALDGELGGLLELLGPVAETVAEPRRLGLERRQAELLPDLSRALHVL